MSKIEHTYQRMYMLHLLLAVMVVTVLLFHSVDRSVNHHEKNCHPIGTVNYNSPEQETKVTFLAPSDYHTIDPAEVSEVSIHNSCYEAQSLKVVRDKALALLRMHFKVPIQLSTKEKEHLSKPLHYVFLSLPVVFRKLLI